ncbi:MAG: LapA family protein [Alteraurantiacibacter sp.]
MQIVRTVVWVLLLVGLLLFSIANWDPTVTVRIWQGIVVDTKIPAIVIVSFAIGFIPMWLYHRASKWRLQRKVQSLENAARTTAATPVARPDGEEERTATAIRHDHVNHTEGETPLRPSTEDNHVRDTAPARDIDGDERSARDIDGDERNI